MAEFRKDLPEKLALWTEEPEGGEEAAIVGQRFLRVALSVAEAYQARKARAGAVDFQDLLVLARDLLRDRPEVRESLQQRVRYLLLDEMQDTDPVQMELVELLCGVGIEHLRTAAVGLDDKETRPSDQGIPERGGQAKTADQLGLGRPFAPGEVAAGLVDGERGPWLAALVDVDDQHPLAGPGRGDVSHLPPGRRQAYLEYVCTRAEPPRQVVNILPVRRGAAASRRKQRNQKPSNHG